MFGRKNDAPLPTVDPAAQQEVRPGSKGRPTPKRREQEAARRKPLVPTDRKAAAKADRESAKERRLAQREALARGDEKALPARDRGPVKKFLRNTVDSRWNVGEILLPLMLVMLVLIFIKVPAVQALALIFVWVIVVVGILDAVLLWRRTRKALLDKFGETPRGAASYTIMRSFQMRMSRVPKPQVARGDKSWR